MTKIRFRHFQKLIKTPLTQALKISKTFLQGKFLGMKKVKLEEELKCEKPLNEPIFPLALFRSFMAGSKETADKICEHEFNLLGSGPRKLGKNIDWQNLWPDAEKDIKNVWELSRFQFLPNLIKVYEIHNDERYALEAKNLISGWILKNPLGQGKNWQCTMETAIRACNFALAWYFLRESPSWKNENFQKTFLTSIAEHGKFILRNLEYGLICNNNHFLADITGLFFLGTLFPQFSEARKWKAIAMHEFENEIQKQIYEDGVDFEASIPYHRLVCEFLGASALLAEANEIYFSQDFLKRLEKMFEFAWYYTKPNGMAPQIGDNDDGRLFILEDFYSWERRDHSHLFWIAAKLFPLNNKFIQEQREQQKTSRGFNFSRIYIMRKNDFYCIVDCGEGGQDGNAGHAHNDTLSFELNINGEDFIIDPGTYVYTSDPNARNHFRSTRMHNTVMIDNEEINRFRKDTVFSMRSDAFVQINKWDSDEMKDCLDAQHNGYKRLKNSVIHRRVFDFDKKNATLKITDNFMGKGEHALSFYFHFAPGTEVKKIGGKIEAFKNGVKIEMQLPEQIAENAVIHDDEVSPSYGVKIPSKTATIRIKYDIKENDNFVFIFRQI
ncbi:alginate lyase family protein [Candidatus Peregrinibacteria bacterium]|nr:alginate lyase family protein [Candidatus Peregrinibacteria bacterium]